MGQEEMFAVTMAEQIACVERETAMRNYVYPKLVAAGRMSQAKADQGLRAMKAVLETLRRLDAGE